MNEETSKLNKLKEAFQRLLPLVDDLADSLGVLLLISLALIGWIFSYFFYFQKFSITISLGISGLTLLPILILSRFWFALENLKDIPKIAEELIEDVTEDTAKNWHAAKSGKKGALNFLGQAKKLFEIRSIIKSAGNVFEQYFNIAPLINPLYWLFGALSFVGLFFVFIVGVILGLISLLG